VRGRTINEAVAIGKKCIQSWKKNKKNIRIVKGVKKNVVEQKYIRKAKEVKKNVVGKEVRHEHYKERFSRKSNCGME